jgi:hypothetical protein
VSGDELASRALQQARRLGAEILVTRTVERIDPNTREVFLDDDDVVRARTVILATGVTWRRLAVDGFDRLLGKGIYYGAARSEASATHGLDVYLVGAGNSAGQGALHFANHARTVTLVVRGDSLEKNMSRYLTEQLAGKSKGAPGAEIGIAAGLHNSIRISYFNSKLSGTTTAPNDLVIFSQGYLKGDQLTTNAKLSDYKISYEYLTWPYPVGGRHFRLKTLWQVQYITLKTIFDAPIKSSTPDSSGAYTDYSTIGSKSYITPAFGLGFHEYATRNFRLEANLSGFWLPHRFNLVDSDATVADDESYLAAAYNTGEFTLRIPYKYRGAASGCFQGQGDARQFAARRHFVEWTRLFAGVCGN